MAWIEKIEESDVYRNPYPVAKSRQAIFPGVVRLRSGELLALFCIGEAFESADMRTWVSRSSDGGRTWQFQGELYNQRELGLPFQLSDYYKPTVLADGSLVALGYAFERRDADRGIGDPGGGGFPPGRNLITFSTDEGRTWSTPRTVDVGSPAVLETSGPAIQLASGSLIAFGPPFTLDATGQRGWTIKSTDGGTSWSHVSDYYASRGGSVAPWETRACEMQPGRVVALFWAYDVKEERHLANHVTVSHDGGQTWSAPIDTSIMGQASNLLWLGGERLLTIHSQRAGDVGLYVRLVDFAGDKWRVVEESVIWGETISQAVSDGIVGQFAELKFGQPSLLALADGELLAFHWCFEDCMYVIKSHRLRLQTG